MAVSKLNPVAAASSKTMFRTTLTSGTSYTVPAGVTYVNVTLVGGGGGGGGGYDDNAGYTRDVGETGCGGQIISSTLSATAGASIAYAIGAGGAGGARSSNGSAGGSTTFTGATTASGGNPGNHVSSSGFTGTAGQSSSNGGVGGGWSNNNVGGTGGAGCIYVEYWA